MATETITATKNVNATINYFPPGAATRVLAGTAGYQRRQVDGRTVQITDIRGSEEDFTLDKNGFQLAKYNWTPVGAKDDDERVKSVVLPETAEVLKKLTGASHVYCYSHQLRCATAEDIIKAAQDRDDSEVLPAAGPTRFAHVDHSEAGSPLVLQQNVPDFEERMKSRWAIINVWRPIERPVTREPLAMLDGSTIKDDDFVGVFAAMPKKAGAFSSVYGAGDGWEMGQVKASDDHRWYYASNVGLDEALVFKIYDTKRDGRARKTPHSAFKQENDSGPPRQSVEVRSLVFWEGEDPE